MVATLTLRLATAADAQAVSALVRTTLALSNGPDYPAAVIERLQAGFDVDMVRAQLAQRHVLVACAGEEVLGTAALEGDMVRTVFVVPEHQGHGIGKALMAAITAEARARDIAVLQVSASVTADPFYRGLGYEKVRDMMVDGEHIVWMRKRLK